MATANMSGKILTTIGLVWFACIALLFGGTILISRFGGVGIDFAVSMSAIKVVLPILLFGWVPVLGAGIYRMKRLR
jgi:hypothetical protein